MRSGSPCRHWPLRWPSPSSSGAGCCWSRASRARHVTIALALFSLVTAVSFHGNFADQNQMIHFLKNVMMAGGLLQIVAFGAGAFSVDSRVAKVRATNERVALAA